MSHPPSKAGLHEAHFTGEAAEAGEGESAAEVAVGMEPPGAHTPATPQRFPLGCQQVVKLEGGDTRAPILSVVLTTSRVTSNSAAPLGSLVICVGKANPS